ncbi:MAG: hypothetical protein WD016_06075 [Balneolaceae bacterium]
MRWIKDVFLDLIVLVLVVIYAFTTNQIIEIILWVYTVLLVLSKVLTFFMPALQKRTIKTSAPDYFYHIIYFISVAIFMIVSHFYLARAWIFTGAWIFIWIASAIQSRKGRKK